jgi:fatty-acyl-CoA synthase
MITTRYELTVPAMLERAEQGFPERDIVSRTPAGIFRYTYREFAHRVGKLASALVAWGVRKGDRVATLAWNHHRHLEACFAAPAIGAVLHPLNHQLPPAQLAQTINHAADKVVIADADLLPRLESVAPSLDTVERYIIMSDGPEVQARLANATSYEALIGPAEPIRQWPELDEWHVAVVCSSTAAAGLPNEVAYTYRGLWLATRAFCLADPIGVTEQDTTLIVAPLFHVNAWALPFAAVWTGSRLVLPGPRPDVKVFCELMQQERVTLAAGVPAVWIDVLALLEREPYSASKVGRVLCRALPLEDAHRAVRAYLPAWDARRGKPAATLDDIA